MAESVREKYAEWYLQNKPQYDACCNIACDLIIKLIKQKKIPFQNVTSRLKEETSFLNKCCNSKYTDPISQITDLCGVRIIGYTSTDVDAIAKLIEHEFSVDWDNSINKSTQLNSDQVGYLSVHYVVGFSNHRLKLAEYSQFKDIKFEIQIRTILQHAWAEIEHDRSYKFSGELPSEIKRRFYLIAGNLELMDREFSRLSSEIDIYAEQIKVETKKGNLNTPIDSTSLIEYLSFKLNDSNISKDFNGNDKEIISELQEFGVSSLYDLDNLVTDGILDISRKSRVPSRNYLCVLRDIMIVSDPEKYFNNVWKNSWTVIPKSDFDLLVAQNPELAKFSYLFSIDDQGYF